MTQEEILSEIHPTLRKKVLQVIEAVRQKGFNIKVAQGLRSLAYQNRLYQQGRTTKGKVVTKAPAGFSPHNYGCAVDFQLSEPVNFKGIMTVFPDVSPVWNIIGAEGKKVGLEWGGDWKSIKDRPHLEVPILKYGKPLLALVGKGNDLSRVWKEVDRVFGGEKAVDAEDVLNKDHSEVWEYTVQSGDTLSGIAKKYLGDALRYVEIKDLNSLKTDDVSIGQVLKMPKR